MRLRFPRESFIPKGATKITDKASDAVAFFKPFQHRPTGTTRYHVLCFAGKAEKPAINWSVRTMERVERTVREYFASRKEQQGRTAARRAERVAFKHSANVGDIYRTSWGFDQTNVDFFQIVEIKGKYAILREIAAAVEGGGPGGERVVPQTDAFLSPRHERDDQGRPIRRLIQQHGIKIDEVRTAYPWGTREPITGTIIGPSCYRTDSMFGH